MWFLPVSKLGMKPLKFSSALCGRWAAAGRKDNFHYQHDNVSSQKSIFGKKMILQQLTFVGMETGTSHVELFLRICKDRATAT